MAAIKATSLFSFILLALICSTAYGHAYGEPSKPDSWICYTTGGAADMSGGNINIKNTTKCDSGKKTTTHTVIGFGCALIAILGFGSNFIPVKKYDTGDGMFFQWILCIGIWLVGLVVNLVRYQPPFFYPVFFGGILWTSGNALVVPIIKTIGLTMGLTIWGATNMLSGWFTGMFILKQPSGCKALNFAGVGVVIISTVILSFVKSEGKQKDEDPFSEKSPLIDSEKARITPKTQSLDGSLSDKLLQSRSIQERITFSPKTSTSSMSDILGKDEDYSWVDKLGKWPRKIVGLSMALGIGFLFGTQFLAVEFMRLCEDDTHSCNELDYIFGHFTGILLVSTFWFAVYSLYMRNKPKVYPKVILPALASGIIWGIAMTGWFVANESLSLAVSFPIITAGPGFVSSAWGILLYREIKGWKNISLYFGGFFVSVCGVLMVALSNNKVQC